MKSTIASTLAFTTFLIGNVLNASALSLDPDTPPVQAELIHAQWTWDNHAASSYDFQYARAHGNEDVDNVCPWTVMIRQGYLDTTLDCNGDEIFTSPPPPTMDALFSMIQDAIDHSADIIDVHFNMELGYPEYMLIDYSLDVIGDEVYLRIPMVDLISHNDLHYERERLNAAREEWNGIEGYHRDYYFEMEVSCQLCPYLNFPWHVTVSNEHVESAVDSKGYTVSKEDLDVFAVSIEEIFWKIDDALYFRADEVHVEYDEIWGYPETVFINRDSRISDLQYDVIISGLDFLN